MHHPFLPKMRNSSVFIMSASSKLGVWRRNLEKLTNRGFWSSLHGVLKLDEVEIRPRIE